MSTIEIGAPVEVTGGPFASWQGTVVAVRADALEVEIDGYGRATVIELTREQVRTLPIHPRRTFFRELEQDGVRCTRRYEAGELRSDIGFKDGHRQGRCASFYNRGHELSRSYE